MPSKSTRASYPAVSVLTLAAVTLSGGAAFAQFVSVPYVFLPDSELLDECLVCGLVTPPVPLHGGFAAFANPPGSDSTFTFGSLQITAGSPSGSFYEGAGLGSLAGIGGPASGETASIFLILIHEDTATGAGFTNVPFASPLAWPKFQATLTQTNGTATHTITLKLDAEPLADIPLRIVSVANHAATIAWPTNYGAATVLAATRVGLYADWVELKPKVNLVGSEYQAAVPATNAAGFFRAHTAN